MIMHHRHHVRTRLVDFTVNHALEEQPVLAGAYRIAVEIEFDDILGGDQHRRHAARQPIPVRVGRVAGADVAIGVEHAMVG